MKFVVNKVALGQVSLEFLRFPRLNNIPPLLRVHLHHKIRDSPDQAAHYHNLTGRVMVQFVTDLVRSHVNS
jgi:hypothetical protein